MTLWTAPYQVPVSMRLSRKDYWSGLPCPPPRDLPNLGTEPTSPLSPALQVDSLPTEPPGKPPNHSSRKFPKMFFKKETFSAISIVQVVQYSGKSDGFLIERLGVKSAFIHSFI